MCIYLLTAGVIAGWKVSVSMQAEGKMMKNTLPKRVQRCHWFGKAENSDALAVKGFELNHIEFQPALVKARCWRVFNNIHSRCDLQQVTIGGLFNALTCISHIIPEVDLNSVLNCFQWVPETSPKIACVCGCLTPTQILIFRYFPCTWIFSSSRFLVFSVNPAPGDFHARVCSNCLTSWLFISCTSSAHDLLKQIGRFN